MRLLYLGKRALIPAVILVVAAVLIGFKASIPASGAPYKEANKAICSVDTNKKTVALTFDTEWENDQTQTVLSILETKGVKATFFVTGFWAAKYPDLIRQLNKSGQEIGNHSTNYPAMTALDASQRELEIQTTNESLAKLTGHQPVLFRAPFGEYDTALVQQVRSKNMYLIQWSLDSLDWKQSNTNQLVNTVMRNIKKGSIIAFHDNATCLTQALPIIIEKLKAKGYEIVPISQLIYKGKYHVDSAGVQHGD